MIALAVLAASPALAADPANGERIAKRLCVACHVVAPGQPPTPVIAPAFAAIAAKRLSREQLAYAMLLPHPRMPDLSLTKEEVEDLSAYIRTLQR